MGSDERSIDRPILQGSAGGTPEPAVRPLSAALRRHAVSLTPAQSDAIGRLVVPGVRRLVELFSLRNGTLCATLRGAGYSALRVYVTPDGRVVENEEASEPDPLGDETEPMVLARDAERLHLGTLLPAEERAARREQQRPRQPTAEGESPA